ncbi:MAG: ornithine--oxo-acid transaminase [Clostridiales bacterium]|jgi:ornithine--oxo-acid transaminase|nr:ornithine--oxo-acid transaminase [Clostridiales bacterium]HOK82350.1 ornithine--oxo-acid transaminase [Clostridia bacterium]HOL61492.1 ornithine--oxo-acid transaminase [Clostridia bacterium]HPO54094.1 ornithine--oxo-acid transaminase [Clostridia bacterium]
MLSSKEIIAKTQKYGTNNYQPKEVVIVKGEGAIAYDPEGREYFDMLSAYSALNFGHCHPELVATAKAQIETLTLTSRAFHNAILGDFCEALAKLTGKDKVLPMNSGAEAVETAIKTARRWGHMVKGIENGKQEIIVCRNNFHGRTVTIISMSTDENARIGYGPYTPGFKVIEYGNAEALEEAITPNTVAFLVEPIQGEAGIIVPPAGYLKKAREICTKHGILLIADEVQTGFARTGKLFACMHEDVEPDIYVLGKALGGGIMPVSAVAANADIMDVFTPGSHGSTFGGNPLAAAIGLKAMEILVRDNYAKMAEEKGAYFISKLKEIENPEIIDIRGKGLLIGVEFSVSAAPYVYKLIKGGVLAKETHERTIRFAPPVIITYGQMDAGLKIIKEALTKH